MNQAQSEALQKVVGYNWTDEERNFKEAGQPKGHICEALEVLQCYLADVAHPYGQAGPIGIVRDHPSYDEGEPSQGPSVIDRGSREIEVRWAKEAVGLVAVELNEAYAQFDTTRDGWSIPSPHLHRASARLVEVMKRLGLADYRRDLDSEIPF